MDALTKSRLLAAWRAGREAAGAALYWSGAAWAYEKAARPEGAVILMYHSVAPREHARYVDPPMRTPPELFERQMAFLARERRVVSLTSLVAELEAGRTPAAGTVCLTFDDGYLDNLTVAAPILARHGLPATLYLPTAYIDDGRPQWVDLLHWSYGARTRERVGLPSFGLGEVDLGSAPAWAAAKAVLHERLIASPLPERGRLLAEIEAAFAPASRPPRLTMTWDDARELRRRYPSFEVGGHSRDHADLSRHLGAEGRAQVADCREALRRELGEEPAHFSFPYERWAPETRDAAAAAGWRSAVGRGPGLRIGAGSDRWALPRVSAPESMTALRFKTGGAYPGALAALGLLAPPGRER